MKFGYFDHENREYVITRPDTPLPWINYLGAQSYCGLMSNTAGGYSFLSDAKERRITRYRYNNIPYDRGGRYIYVKDKETKEFWSVSWQPTNFPAKENPNWTSDLRRLHPHDYHYECRHGLGYTIIQSAFKNIHTKTTYFVPLGEDLEIWKCEITALPERAESTRKLSIFSFIEFCLWDALNDMTDYQYNLNIGETEFKQGIIYHMSRNRVDGPFYAYFMPTNARVMSFDTQRRDFLGAYGDLSAPEAIVKGKCSNSIAGGWAPIGAHHLEITLKPGETKTIIFVLGVTSIPGSETRIQKQYSTPAKVDKAFFELKRYWQENLDTLQTETPSDGLNHMVNTWNAYQCRTTFNWSRSASYYEAGIGRGMGFRDSNQDTLGFVHQIPKEVKQRIIDIASTQFEEGDAHHQYSPLSKKGNGRGYSDDHLWLILSTASYIKETGDVGFLKQHVPFESGKTSTQYDHLVRAVEYSVHHTGPHGLPLMGFADWNDCLNLGTRKNRAESVLVGQMLVATAKELANLAELIGKAKDADRYRRVAADFSGRLNKYAWDGEWYRRAYTDDGDPVGSHKNKEGKIYLETQPWAVISGSASPERSRMCMDSVQKHLSTPYGIMLLDPPYQKFHPELGSISVYPPGLKENGAIFCHPNPWAMVAECMLGRGDQAFQYYLAILPAAKNDIAEIYKTEPYVYSQMIAGKSHKNFGEAKNSWLTGTAAWNYVAASQWILGIRPEYSGLRIDPCIPKDWRGFNAKRVYRGNTYFIKVLNPNKVNKGVVRVIVNKKEIAGNILPIGKVGSTHLVEVTMG